MATALSFDAVAPSPIAAPIGIGGEPLVGSLFAGGADAFPALDFPTTTSLTAHLSFDSLKSLLYRSNKF
jgi:hypothetical protein